MLIAKIHMDNFSLAEYVNRLIQEKGFTDVQEEVMSELKMDLEKRVEKVLYAEILKALPPEKLEEFEKLLDEDVSEEVTQNFLKEHIEGMENIITTTLVRFKDIYIGKTETFR